MKKVSLYYLLLFALIINFSSCADKDEDTPAPTKLELLTAKTWKPNKISVNGADMTNDPFVGLALQLNYKFNTDKTYTVSFMGMPEPGTWEFTSNETVIVLDAGTDDETRWTIVELNDKSLKATEIDPTDNSQTQWEFVPKP